MADALRSCGDRTSAWTLLQPALSGAGLPPDEAQVLLRIAAEVGPVEAVAEWAETYAGRYPEIEALHALAAGLRASTGDGLRAQQTYARWESLHPQNPIPGAERLRLALFDPQVTEESYAGQVRAWAQRQFGAFARWKPPLRRDSSDRLRIGYVSQNFLGLPRGSLIAPVLSRHSARDFQVFLYTSTSAECPHDSESLVWRDVAGLRATQLANTLRQDEIDIAINVDGLFDVRAAAAFAYGCAPVQVALGNYFASTGLSAFDARLCHPQLQPAALCQPLYAEPLFETSIPVYTYTPPEHSPAPRISPMRRNGFCTFGSSNSALKLQPEVLDTFGQVLSAAPHSRLLLHCPGLIGDLQQRLVSRICASGVAPERIECVGSLPHWDHLELHNSIDIMLDSFPFCGATTTLDALWMGKPVLTLDGPGLRGGCSAYMLRETGLSEWIAPNRDAYVELAVKSSKSPASLPDPAQLRSRLLASSLMDHQAWIAGLEDAYRSLWQAAARR